MPPLPISSTHRIPFPGSDGWYLEGTLERKGGPGAPTQGRAVALILHGSLGHRDYLYQRTLSPLLPIDTFRFDFRSNARSPGPQWRYSGLPEDTQDVHVVAAWLREQWGYRVRLVVGHSRGAVVGMRWVWEDERRRRARGEEGEVWGVGNVSGRYRMEKVRELTQHMLPAFASHGHYDWHVRVAGSALTARVYPSEIDRFAAYDAARVAREFPRGVHVLTLHGMRDTVVPPFDAVLYARAFERREREGGTGTHTMCYIEESDHNHKGHFEQVNDTIVRWWETVEDGSVRSGWAPAWEPREREEKSKL